MVLRGLGHAAWGIEPIQSARQRLQLYPFFRLTRVQDSVPPSQRIKMFGNTSIHRMFGPHFPAFSRALISRLEKSAVFIKEIRQRLERIRRMGIAPVLVSRRFAQEQGASSRLACQGMGSRCGRLWYYHWDENAN